MRFNNQLRWLVPLFLVFLTRVEVQASGCSFPSCANRQDEDLSDRDSDSDNYTNPTVEADDIDGLLHVREMTTEDDSEDEDEDEPGARGPAERGIRKKQPLDLKTIRIKWKHAQPVVMIKRKPLIVDGHEIRSRGDGDACEAGCFMIIGVIIFIWLLVVAIIHGPAASWCYFTCLFTDACNCPALIATTTAAPMSYLRRTTIPPAVLEGMIGILEQHGYEVVRTARHLMGIAIGSGVSIQTNQVLLFICFLIAILHNATI